MFSDLYFLLYLSYSFSCVLGVRAHVRVDMSIREHVKPLVLSRRDMYEGHVDPTEEPSSKRTKCESGSSRLGEASVWLHD